MSISALADREILVNTRSVRSIAREEKDSTIYIRKVLNG